MEAKMASGVLVAPEFPGRPPHASQAVALNIMWNPRRPPVNRHRPSVDVVPFDRQNCVWHHHGGMGDDGAHGLKGKCMTQVPKPWPKTKTCVVYGMPKEAVKLGAIDHILPLEETGNDRSLRQTTRLITC